MATAAKAFAAGVRPEITRRERSKPAAEAARPFVRADRAIGIDRHDQRVAKGARLLQVPNVAWMHEIEDAVGKDDDPATATHVFRKDRRLVPCGR